MRATDLHRAALALRNTRASDMLAIVVTGCAFVLLLGLVIGGAVSLLDWLDGREQQVWPQLASLLARVD